MIRNLCLYEKKIGLEETDKDIFVLNKKPNARVYVNMGKLIEKNGGLLKIPFLCKSHGLIYIIKFWG